MTKNKYIKVLGLEENISKIVYETVKRYQKIWGEKNLYFYDNWKDDIIDEIVDYIKNREKINSIKQTQKLGVVTVADGTKGMNRGE